MRHEFNMFSVFVFVAAVCANVWFVGCAGTGGTDEPTSGSEAAKSVKYEDSTAFALDNKRELAYTRLPAPEGYLDEYPTDAAIQANAVLDPNLTPEDAWSEYTVEERMLANGYELLDANGAPLDPPRIIRPVEALVARIASFYHATGSVPEGNEDLLARKIDLSRKRIEKGEVTEDEVRERFYTTITSPVTGNAIEWNHQDFSRGNAFITVLNENAGLYQALESEEETRLGEGGRDAWPETFREEYEKRGLERVYVFYRVYGNSGIIDSGTKVSGWFAESDNE